MAAKLALNGMRLVTLSDTAATALQEKASLVVIKEAIKRNKTFSEVEIVEGSGSTGKYIQEKIFEQYPIKYHPNKDWLVTFFKQQLTFFNSRIGSKPIGTDMKYQEYDRDNPNGFMDFISDLVKSEYGISKKDTWNPADIWLVYDKDNVRKQLISATKHPTIDILNETLRRMLRDKTVIGISLKKVTKGKPARWDVVNLTKAIFTEKDDFEFEWHHGRLALGLRPDGKNYTAQDTVIYVYEKGAPWADLQVTGTTRRFANLKFEPTARGAAGARLGKAPVDMVKELLLTYKISRQDINELMSHTFFPKTTKEFADDKQYYKEAFTRVKNSGLFDMGVSSPTEFYDDTQQLFQFAETTNGDEAKIRAGRAMTKLMQLHFADILAKLKRSKGKNTVDQLITSIIFLAMKKGPRFGPFGKLY